MNKDNKFQFKIRTPLNLIQEAETVDVDIYGVVMNGASYWDEDTGVSNVLSQLQGLDPLQSTTDCAP